MSNNAGFCMHCGTPYREGELFCQNCGKRVLADLRTGSQMQNTGSGGARSGNGAQWNRQQSIQNQGNRDQWERRQNGQNLQGGNQWGGNQNQWSQNQRQEGSVYQTQSQNASGRNSQWNSAREMQGDMERGASDWQAYGYPEEKKKKGGRVLIVCGILAAVAALAVLCIVIFAYPKSDNSKDSPNGVWETESKEDGSEEGTNQQGNGNGTQSSASQETSKPTVVTPTAPLPTEAIQEISDGSENGYSDADSGVANARPTPTKTPEIIYPTVQQYDMPTNERIPIYPDGPHDNDETHRLKFVDSSASSDANKKFDDNNYGRNDNYVRKAESAIDLDIETSWQEGASGNGEGEWIELSFESPKTVEYFNMYLGNWRVPDGNDYYGNNCSPKKITMYANGQKYSMSFVRKKVLQRVTFEEPVTAKEFRFVIEEAYVGGDQYHDCCISEIIPYGTE